MNTISDLMFIQPINGLKHVWPTCQTGIQSIYALNIERKLLCILRRNVVNVYGVRAMPKTTAEGDEHHVSFWNVECFNWIYLARLFSTHFFLVSRQGRALTCEIIFPPLPSMGGPASTYEELYSDFMEIASFLALSDCDLYLNEEVWRLVNLEDAARLDCDGIVAKV